MVVFLMAGGTLAAQTLGDLQQYRTILEQQRQVVQQQQQQLRALTKPAQDRLEALRRNIQVTDTQLASTEAELARSKEAFRQLEQQLAQLEEALGKQRQSVGARLRFLQRQSRQRWWVLVLGSRDLQQFADRRRQMERIWSGDRQLLVQLTQMNDRVIAQRDRVAIQANEIALVSQKLKQQKANLEVEASAQANMIDRIMGDRRALELAEDRLVQDSQRLTSLIVARARTNPGLVLIPGTGRLMVPTYGEVTSRFGWRIHPILGYERFHSGMDFGADLGTLIYAADTGTVIYADWYGGYGNAVIVDHGNGLTTLYAHCSELYVKEGQPVQKGQPIAAVGSTGYSTGPHLHFEVRLQGEPVDPASYL
ncbi:MAG: peptidoglycan DD-metalloendopeptidase family protein [Oscillatoriales cyanobacterium SM2_2_1]|nr:peptidoglycan DD-metalloendopeptidase family protein [Oscillatoriales cyanobacterium SM2_2_1]